MSGKADGNPLLPEPPKCSICLDSGWVCENHADKPWAGLQAKNFPECCGGAGMPCRCNKADPPWKHGEAIQASTSLSTGEALGFGPKGVYKFVPRGTRRKK